MTAQEFIAQMEAIISLAETGIETAAAINPALEIPVVIVEQIVPVVEKLVEAAVTAFSGASGTPITLETITALLPNATPLTPPPPAA